MEKKVKFSTSQFGLYEAKLSTERGVMSATMFYNAGECIPHEIWAKFRRNGKTYRYFKKFNGEEANKWILDAKKNRELFSQIREDWEKKCDEFMKKFSSPMHVIADRGSLLIRANGAVILIPNGVGDGAYTVQTITLNVLEAYNLSKVGFYEVAQFESGTIAIESDDCGTGSVVFETQGPVSLQRDRNGNFALVKIMNEI